VIHSRKRANGEDLGATTSHPKKLGTGTEAAKEQNSRAFPYQSFGGGGEKGGDRLRE